MSLGHFDVGCRPNTNADGARSGERHWPTGERLVWFPLKAGFCTWAEYRRGEAPGEPYEGKLQVRLCVQRRLACSVGGESHRGKSQKPRNLDSKEEGKLNL